MKHHVFTAETLGSYEVVQLDGVELENVHSYSVERMPDGTGLLTIRLVIENPQIYSSERVSTSG